jgi:hypothetical protein
MSYRSDVISDVVDAVLDGMTDADLRQYFYDYQIHHYQQTPDSYILEKAVDLHILSEEEADDIDRFGWGRD